MVWGTMSHPFLGVISDTHGLLRPQALAALEGSTRILHAGDVGDPVILGQLQGIAPVTAVRGNVDHGAWAEALPQQVTVDFEGMSLHMLHIQHELKIDPMGTVDAVIFGHSHQPLQERQNRVLYFNPGSAGPRRFSLPVTVGRLWVENGRLDGEIIELEV